MTARAAAVIFQLPTAGLQEQQQRDQGADADDEHTSVHRGLLRVPDHLGVVLEREVHILQAGLDRHSPRQLGSPETVATTSRRRDTDSRLMTENDVPASDVGDLVETDGSAVGSVDQQLADPAGILEVVAASR